jgi:hypothetical protein
MPAGVQESDSPLNTGAGCDVWPRPRRESNSAAAEAAEAFRKSRRAALSVPFHHEEKFILERNLRFWAPRIAWPWRSFDSQR